MSSKWEAEVGNPNTMVRTEHITARSLQTRVFGAIGNFAEFGSKFNHDLKERCDSLLAEVRNINPPSMERGVWREWQVRDDYSGVTLVIRFRRIE